VQTELRPCPGCGDDTVFEQPPCADGHTGDGGECPEWLCTGCGAGFLLAGPDTGPDTRSDAGPGAAGRRAA
jgi:hypothetical protein